MYPHMHVAMFAHGPYIKTYIHTNVRVYTYIHTYSPHTILEYLRIDKNLKLSVNIQLLDYYLVYTETRLSYSLIFLYIINYTHH